MGLLGLLKKDKKKSTPIEVQPFEKKTIECSDLASEIDNLARVHQMNAKQLDFKILSYKTLYKKVGSARYRELQEAERQKFLMPENILNPELEILQKLKVEIFEKKRSAFPIKIAIGANKNLTTVIATFKMQDPVNYFDGLEAEILAELDRKKAKLGILLGCFDAEVRKEVKKLVSYIRVNKKIEEDIKITLCQSFDMQPHIKGHINYLFKEKSGDQDEKKKVDHSDKGFMHTIKEGATMIEVVKSKEGKPGRNCKGAIIALEEIELTSELPTLKVSEDIECKEEEERILYIAKRSGFINQVGENAFEIRDELVVNEVSFKTTGSIEAGDDKDIKINIESSDMMSDAIGAGVHIETSEVKAAGNVGNGAVVKASVIEIGGQTHQSAKLYGGNVKINLHKGYVEGETIHIDLLEAGKVVGDVVHIKKVAGGEIEAREIYVDTVLSNVQAYASHHIEIQKVEGTGNKFIIDARAQRGFKEKVEKIEKRIKESNDHIEKVTKRVTQLKQKIQKEKEMTMKIHARIQELKSGGVNPPSSLVSKIRENQNRIKEHNSLLKELKDAKINAETLNEELKNLQSSVFDAKVINHSTWREFNEVTFKIINPPVHASLFMKDAEMAPEITLQAAEDGEFILARKG